jgi:hypothetical protein
MFAFRTNLFNTLPIGRWHWGAVLVFCLALAGCCNMDVCGHSSEDSFREDGLSGTSQQMRPAERNNEAFGFSNRARQIERNLGYQ